MFKAIVYPTLNCSGIFVIGVFHSLPEYSGWISVMAALASACIWWYIQKNEVKGGLLSTGQAKNLGIKYSILAVLFLSAGWVAGTKYSYAAMWAGMSVAVVLLIVIVIHWYANRQPMPRISSGGIDLKKR